MLIDSEQWGCIRVYAEIVGVCCQIYGVVVSFQALIVVKQKLEIFLLIVELHSVVIVRDVSCQKGSYFHEPYIFMVGRDLDSELHLV